ncbi:SWIM zinc finger family protein [Paenibacillus eucommiae]|uniref:Zn finger protein n=1 Tax=Paenibacillus eucommiae TaxID=1355755 RepID=A0ABS4J5W9_9BACL|nr:hypothetical protein [Paenibacillus eucommiae]MBP1994199.1 putative Zn finger protein [Paenibacillus eucommiae]
MSATPALNDEQWLQLLEEVAKTFNEVTLKRGFTYFKQQLVTSLNVSKDRVVQANVTGPEDCSVTLRLNNFSSSSCTCPAQASCKHLAAVIMEMADRLGYPASQIVNPRQFLEQAASAASSKSAIKQLPGMDVVGWHEFLNQYTAHIQSSYDQEAYAAALRDQAEHIHKANVPFSAIDWIYFELHQELFILQKITEQIAQSSANTYTYLALRKKYDEMHTWFLLKSTHFNFRISPERLQQTLGYIRLQMAKETGHKYLNFNLYTAMWKQWIAPYPDTDQWAAQEINDIEKHHSGSNSDSISASMSAAKAFLYLNQSKSKEAWAVLEAGGGLDKVPASLFLFFLNHIFDSQDWTSLLEWLIHTSSSFYGQSATEIDTYLGYWKEAVSHLPEADQHLWNVLEGMLPHSTLFIEERLYEQHKWKSWVEMQILQDRSPLYHRVNVLEPIEKEDPAVLLPYYHQSIEHFVALKNRHEYELAVKLLKRLKKVYMKMKEVERWNNFFTSFIDRHSWLKALQEEMRKGKLLE